MNDHDKRAHRVARTARQKHPEEPAWTPGSLEHHRYDSHERRRNEKTSVEDPGLVALGVVTEANEATIDAARGCDCLNCTDERRRS